MHQKLFRILQAKNKDLPESGESFTKDRKGKEETYDRSPTNHYFPVPGFKKKEYFSETDIRTEKVTHRQEK